MAVCRPVFILVLKIPPAIYFMNYQILELVFNRTCLTVSWLTSRYCPQKPYPLRHRFSTSRLDVVTVQDCFFNNGKAFSRRRLASSFWQLNGLLEYRDLIVLAFGNTFIKLIMKWHLMIGRLSSSAFPRVFSDCQFSTNRSVKQLKR